VGLMFLWLCVLEVLGWRIKDSAWASWS